MELFGIKLESLSHKELLVRCTAWLSGNDFHRISTVNPEFLLRAREDSVFAENLRLADLRSIDGFGIVLVAWFFGKHVRRLPGADLLQMLLAQAEKKQYSVFLAIRQDGLSSYEDIKQSLMQSYPRLVIDGENMHAQHWTSTTNHSSSCACKKQSEIVFCNFGAPEQEYFAEHLREESKSIRLAMGVGGSFDYLTGKLTRAPKWMRQLGLEWFWRLVMQPHRIGRVWRATGVFLYRSFTDK
jgi:N-acetylglucosaminyldiphosphoundecaprenol N-acetyl-beta-D-mannosaminyltransferase